MIKELDLGGLSLTEKHQKNQPKTDATHALKSPERSLDGSCHVVVLLGKSARSGTVRFVCLYSHDYILRSPLHGGVV